ncbi:MAG: CDP-alcohol phosphatidyltransferase family protein [Actinobacteria bacterium]|nr:CDP-alcohol phosphatidyltransferase family protein [Actinomycetota bacterium]
MASPAAQLSSHKYLTAPNAFTLARLCCIPLFLWMLFGRDNVAGAAFLLGGLGATDWVDGWLARHFNQTSEFGKMFDPTADRLLFIVAITGIIIEGIEPLWFFWLVIAREVIVGGTIAIATLVFKMKRFDVTWWGKTATFLLMFAIPGLMIGASDFTAHRAFLVAAWLLAIPGLALSYYTGLAYVPTIRDSVRVGRSSRG